MEAKVKCKKCGRVLRNPLSIAMGMGPKCAGISVSQGKSVKARLARHSGKSYAADRAGSQQLPLMPGQPAKKLSRRELVRIKREERRRLFEQRKAFQCGMLTGKDIPLIYEPVGKGKWKEKASGQVISHEHLQNYLLRFRLI